MDIGSQSNYPANSLSNFHPHPFKFNYDGIEVYVVSMEGLLQSFKFKHVEIQKSVCKLAGKAAKFRGKPKKWHRTQTLWWAGKEIDRHSQDYQDLLDAAYSQMCDQNDGFRRALLASGDGTLTHSIGKRDAHQTILTISEFCGRLIKLRKHLTKSKK